jgi:hypothetical protein
MEKQPAKSRSIYLYETRLVFPFKMRVRTVRLLPKGNKEEIK